MGVAFSYNIGSSPLAQKYNDSSSKLNGTIRSRISSDCPNLLETLDNTLAQLDNAVQKANDVIARVSDTITEVQKCILGKDDPDVIDLHKNMAERTKQILDGNDLDSARDKVNELYNYIIQLDDNVQAACDYIASTLSTIINRLSEMLNRMIILDTTLDGIGDLASDIAEVVQKVAALLNCINNALIKDDINALEDVVKYTRPEEYDIYKEAKNVLQNGGNIGEVQIATQQKIAEKVNKSTRVQSYSLAFSPLEI